MKFFLILLGSYYLIASTELAIGQPEISTIRYYDSGQGLFEYFYDIYQKNDGGYFACGVSNNRAWIMSVDRNCQLEWQDILGSTSFRTVIELENGDALVGGKIDGSFAIIRYSPEGEQLWVKYIGSGTCHAIIELKDGTLIAGGYCNLYGYLTAMDEAGQQLWQHSYGGEGDYMHIKAIRETGNGLMLAGFRGAGHTGWSQKVEFNGERQWFRGYANNTIYPEIYGMISVDDGFVVAGTIYSDQNMASIAIMKIDSDGEPQWVESYARERRVSSFGRCVANIHNNGLAVVGYTNAIEQFGPGYPLTICTNENGMTHWENRFTDIIDHQPQNLDAQHYGNFLLSVIVSPDNSIVACGGMYNPDGNTGTDAIIVRIEPETQLPIIFYHLPEDTMLTVLPQDTVTFVVRARDQ